MRSVLLVTTNVGICGTFLSIRAGLGLGRRAPRRAPTRPERYGRPMPTPHQALFYDYVENAVEARAPHREAHLALVKRYVDEGRIPMAGALGNPPHGGLII